MTTARSAAAWPPFNSARLRHQSCPRPALRFLAWLCSARRAFPVGAARRTERTFGAHRIRTCQTAFHSLHRVTFALPNPRTHRPHGFHPRRPPHPLPWQPQDDPRTAQSRPSPARKIASLASCVPRACAHGPESLSGQRPHVASEARPKTDALENATQSLCMDDAWHRESTA